MKRIALIYFFLFFADINCFSQSQQYNGGRLFIGDQVYILNDSLNSYSIDDVVKASNLFYKSKSLTPNFDISSSTYWMRFSIKNVTDIKHLYLEIGNALIDTCYLYELTNDKAALIEAFGCSKLYSERKYKFPDFVFDLDFTTDATKTYILKIKSSDQLLVPLIVSNNQTLSEDQNTKDLVSGIHIGVLLVMILYNFFIFASTKDRSYLYYIFYILFIGLAQITLTGYAYKYLFPGSPAFLKMP